MKGRSVHELLGDCELALGAGEAVAQGSGPSLKEYTVSSFPGSTSWPATRPSLDPRFGQPGRQHGQAKLPGVARPH